MKKKALISLITLGVLSAFVVAGIVTSNNSQTGLDEGSSLRTADEILNQEVIYLDDEALAAAESSDSSSELRSDAIEAYNKVNEQREAAGLNDLSWNPNLEAAASVRAEESSVTFSHTRPNGKQWYTVDSTVQGGENLAWGQTTPTQVVNEWMASPTHKDNILYPEFTSAAVSLYEADNGTPYWALEFGY